MNLAQMLTGTAIKPAPDSGRAVLLADIDPAPVARKREKIGRPANTRRAPKTKIEAERTTMSVAQSRRLLASVASGNRNPEAAVLRKALRIVLRRLTELEAA